MRASLNIISPIARSEPPTFAGGGRTRVLEVRRSPRARAMRLAVDPRDGAVRLTLPARTALRQGFAWAETKRGWIEGALAALPRHVPIAHGATIPFQGRELLVDWSSGCSRGVRRDGDVLVVGGPAEHLGLRVLRWLKAEALRTLDRETRAIADAGGIALGRIGIGDPRSRWGSCSASGDIRYSWRLILAPPDVLRATVAHEVAHRLHMHHGPAFHRAVADLFGREPVAERAWLKAHGATLWMVVD